MFGYFENKVNEIWNTVAPEASSTDLWFKGVAKNDFDYISNRLTEEDATSLLNLTNAQGYTALHVACMNGHYDLVKFFLENEADVNRKGEFGNTVLHCAAMSGNELLVNYFIDMGFKISEKNNVGKSAYDLTKGINLKQNLMKIVFKEEQELGTAPQFDPNLMGITRDETQANAAPPPGAMAPPPSASQEFINYTRNRKPVGNTIKENDGFGTTVGNPELSAKYGNEIRYAHFEAAPVNASANPPITTTAAPRAPIAQRRVNPPRPAFSKPSGVPSVRPNSQVSGARPPAAQTGPRFSLNGAQGQKVKVFNPGAKQINRDR